MRDLTNSQAWKLLSTIAESMKSFSLKDLVNTPDRFEKFSLEFNDTLYDYSKNFIDDSAIQTFCKLAEEVQLKSKIDAMFGGEKINATENRAVLHTALRNKLSKEIIVDGENVIPKIKAVLQQMKSFADGVHNAKILGSTGKKFTDIVNIGIGGSDLGPAMICSALRPYAVEGINAHFVSNVDATDIAETLKKLNPETTLFIIASKTFTTQETLRNARSAKAWFLNDGNTSQEDIAKHFIALSTNEKAVREFGISPDNMFEFWDWVGGRYSLWSAIGLSIALYIGFDNFDELLLGAFKMDEHFRTAPFDRNIPVIMAMLGIYYTDFWDAESMAIIPYDQYLDKFPAFLQQLDMESNGKSVTLLNEEVDYKTGPIIWGQPGTNAQHSFFQLIHQGTRLIPVDFIAGVNSHNPIEDHQQMLLSNFFAQTEALMNGKNSEAVISELTQAGMNQDEIRQLIPHKIFKGNRPTNSILYKQLTPSVLGSLIAMYEHKVFVQGAVWGLNSFDQWGVELGKQLANRILPELQNAEPISSHDTSTNGLINYYKTNRK